MLTLHHERASLPGSAATWAVVPARPPHAQALADLCAAHAAYEQIPYQPEGHAERLAQGLCTGRIAAWLGMLDGVPVGYASATHDYSTLSGQPFLHLDCLYLEPAARGLGLGPALMETVFRHARSLGCEAVQWQTPVWNEGAIRFYDRLGARRLAKQRYTYACR